MWEEYGTPEKGGGRGPKAASVRCLQILRCPLKVDIGVPQYRGLHCVGQSWLVPSTPSFGNGISTVWCVVPGGDPKASCPQIQLLGQAGHILKSSTQCPGPWVQPHRQRDRFHTAFATAVALSLSWSQVSPQIISLFLMSAEIPPQSNQRGFKIKKLLN